MAIEHRNIPESGLHEPKGVSTAASKRVYRSDGAGSGAWLQVDSDTLQGTINNSTPAGRRIVADGSGGFDAELTPGHAFGTMNLTDNATVKAVTAATDSTLNTNTDFVEFDIVLSFDNVQNMGTGTNSLQIQESGIYLIDFWCNVSSSVNSTKFSLKFVIDGVTFVPRGPKFTMPTANVIHNMSANGLHSFTSGEEVKLYIAADKTCNIRIEDMTFQMVFLGGL